MSDLMRILGIARRALNAHQAAMNSYGNNIANVNTEGYSRQRVTLKTTTPLRTPQGFLGSGVSVDSVERIRSTLVDQQLMGERPSLNQYEFKNEALQFIEGIFNEPSDFGINRNLEDFFNSFHDLANDPESTAARTVVRQKGVALANNFNRIDRQLRSYQKQLNAELSQNVDEVNRITSQIARLNKNIVNAEVNGHQAPDLRDQRDLLVDDLSKLVDVRTFENEAGSISVHVAGRTLVVDSYSEKLSLVTQSDAAAGPIVVSEQDGSQVNFTDGKIKGLLDVRDGNIPDYLSQLDQLAVSLATEVNAVHAIGYNLDDISGINLFDPNTSGAGDFAISVEVMNDANLIAASDVTGEPGNNNVALAIANLQDDLTINDGQFTFNDFYNSLISKMGSDTQEAGFLQSGYSLTVERLEFTRQSISGVSLDEEMTNLIEARQAYTAATRLITTIDEMAQTVLNMV